MELNLAAEARTGTPRRNITVVIKLATYLMEQAGYTVSVEAVKVGDR